MIIIKDPIYFSRRRNLIKHSEQASIILKFLLYFARLTDKQQIGKARWSGPNLQTYIIQSTWNLISILSGKYSRVHAYQDGWTTCKFPLRQNTSENTFLKGVSRYFFASHPMKTSFRCYTSQGNLQTIHEKSYNFSNFTLITRSLRKHPQ